MTVAIARPEAASLIDLAEVANREHALVNQSGTAMIHHAIRAGDALLEAKRNVETRGWRRWLDDNFHGSQSCALNYTRIAEHKEQLGDVDTQSIAGALRVLRGVPTAVKKQSHPQEIRQEALALIEEGVSISEISRQIGVDRQTIRGWNDPAVLRRQRAKNARQRAQRKARDEAEQQRKVQRGVRKAGGALAESYSLVRKTAQAADQARAEAASSEVRRHMEAAYARLREAEDEIVKAVGIS